MKFAFCLLNYFPFGGLQRDFMRIAKACVAAGHEVHVFTGVWQGECDPSFRLHILPTKAWTNHGRALAFARAFKKMLKNETFDAVLGFNKLPGLDFYYAADVCYQARVRETRPWWVRLTPRYRAWVSLERAVFGAESHTNILLISPAQQAAYEACYHTPANRFHALPPGIAKDRIPVEGAALLREQMRSTNAIPKDHFVLLMLASSFKTKGLDRAIASFAALPNALRARAHLWVVGQDDPQPYQKQAMALGVHSRLRFFGGRHDVPRFLLAADALVHPAYHENTGTVLLEALVAGLPVITVAACGYAHYITESQAGVVVPEPFHALAWNEALTQFLSALPSSAWRANALAFAQSADLYSMPERVVEMLQAYKPKRLSTT